MITDMNRVIAMPDALLSPWVLLLSGLSQTAIGVGLLLGQVAAVVEHRTASLPQRADVAAITWLREPAALDKAVA